MDAHVRAALQAIDEAVESTGHAGPIEITPQHAADIERVMQLPENQSGADKSRVWRVYALCRSHWARAVAT